MSGGQYGSGEPWITHLEQGDDDASDAMSWNHETSGMPGVWLFGNALQVWSLAQNRDVTVAEAAIAFNVKPELIRQAVAAHAWLLLGRGDTIEHEGE